MRKEGKELNDRQKFQEKTDVSQHQMFDKFSNFPDRKKSVKGLGEGAILQNLFIEYLDSYFNRNA